MAPVYINKWQVFSAAIFIQATSGLTYVFSVYSPELKKALHLKQPQIEMIGSSANMGGYFGIISGLTYDYFDSYFRAGPRGVLMVGLVVNVVGYTVLFLAASNRIATEAWQVGLIAAMATNAGTWYDTVAIVTCLRNFPEDRGTVVGVLKSFVGLSGSMFTQVYLTYFEPDAISFIIFMAVAASAVPAVVSLWAVNHVPFEQDSEKVPGDTARRFGLAYTAVFLLAAYLMAASLWESQSPGILKDTKELLVAGMLVLAAPLLFLAMGAGGIVVRPPQGGVGIHQHLATARGPFEAHHCFTAAAEDAVGGVEAGRGAAAAVADAGEGGGGGVETPLLGGAEHDAGDVEEEPPLATADHDPSPREAEDRNLWQAAGTAEFWILFVLLVNGAGSSLVLLNNLGEMVEALGGGHDGQDVFVSLFSIANCCGRLLAGYTSQLALRRYGVPRTWFLLWSAVGTSLICLLASVSSLPMLYPTSFLMGLCFGCYWSLFPTVTSEVFGLRHMGSIYNTLMSAPAIGGLTFSYFASILYERARARDTSLGDACIGVDCFRPTFLYLAGIGCVGVAAAGLMVRRTRAVYARVYAQLLLHQSH